MWLGTSSKFLNIRYRNNDYSEVYFLLGIFLNE